MKKKCIFCLAIRTITSIAHTSHASESKNKYSSSTSLLNSGCLKEETSLSLTSRDVLAT